MAFPQILTLNPHELIDWCNVRRKEMGISKAKLAEMTNVPESTLDRILSGKNPEFRYSTVQPIVSVLLGVHEEVPEPDIHDDSQHQYYYQTIEGYKLVLENKNHIINEAKDVYEQMAKQVAFLKAENAQKDETIAMLQEHLKWMEKFVDKNTEK